MTQPLRRVGAKGEGRFEQIGWDEALAATAGGLRSAIDRHGPESVLPYYFAGTEGMIQGWIMGPRLFAAMGASRLQTTICTRRREMPRCGRRTAARSAWIPRSSSTRG